MGGHRRRPLRQRRRCASAACAPRHDGRHWRDRASGGLCAAAVRTLGATGRQGRRAQRRPAGGAMTGGGGPYSAVRARWAASGRAEGVGAPRAVGAGRHRAVRARALGLRGARAAATPSATSPSSVRRAAATAVEGTVQAAQLGVWAQLGNWADDDPEARARASEEVARRSPTSSASASRTPRAPRGGLWPRTADGDVRRRWGLVRAPQSRACALAWIVFDRAAASAAVKA